MADPQRATTIKDVAARLGVSTASVSRALTGMPGVGEPLRERIRETAREMGLHTHRPASAMRSKRTRTLGLVVSDVTNPFFAELALTIERAAAARNYSLLLANSEDDPEQESRYLRSMFGHRVEGIVLNPTLRSDHLAYHEEVGVPIVLLDRAVTTGTSAPVVAVDPDHAIGELVGLFAATGCRRLAMISGPEDLPNARRRLRAFEQAAARHGLQVPKTLIAHGDYTADSGDRLMRHLLRERVRPDAVFIANNLMTLGALRAVRESSVRVPDELSIASFDDVAWFEVTDPPVTAIAQPVVDLGTAAVRALTDLIAGRPAPSARIDARLVIRASCRTPPN
ncbi:LacI family DNA-binding transcriptional regulator [Actinomadura vinacea]|uniref:LacI family DNA-binding transcriptional regulator n=1 Tax=Actinomadura vinacea TaxID=115336 RepID=A0ABP5VVB5_9ACTN